MQEGDEVGAEVAWDEAFTPVLVANGIPVHPRTPESIAQSQQRMRYLQGTDPGGSWVADDDGRIVGIAQSHIRGDVWVLSMLGVVPEFQDAGVGRKLLQEALAYGGPDAPGAIFASPDPRAVHRYASAGFELHPAAAATGPVRKKVEPQPGVVGGGVDDLGTVHEVDLAVRGADRRGDVAWLLSMGTSLLVHPDGGYALGRGGRLMMLSALNEDIATAVLLTFFARCPENEDVEVNWITAEQQWAIRAAVTSGVTLRSIESVMIRGPWQPELPHLPNGVFG